MRKSLLLQLLKEIGVKPSRKLGQNFLFDANLLELIANTIHPKPEELIIEIGGGVGNLTDFLLPPKPNVTVVEYDVRLAEFLQKKYQAYPKVKIINADASRLNYDHLTLQKSYKCVGNLPYSAASVILARILYAENRPKSMYFLLQKEMAQRLRAYPGRKSYGSISVRTQILYDINIIKTISPNVFWPVPGVESEFISLKLKSNHPNLTQFQRFSQIVKLAFAHRRKQMLSNLQKQYEKTTVIRALKELGLNENIRAENLSPIQFLSFTRMIEDVIPSAQNN